MRDPETILREAARTLDFTRPIAVLLLEVLNFIVDDDQAYAIVDRLRDALPAGSHLLLSHPTAEIHREAMLAYTRLWNDHVTPPITTRSPQQLTGFFGPLELEPGVVPISGHFARLREWPRGSVCHTHSLGVQQPEMRWSHDERGV